MHYRQRRLLVGKKAGLSKSAVPSNYPLKAGNLHTYQMVLKVKCGRAFGTIPHICGVGYGVLLVCSIAAFWWAVELVQLTNEDGH
ncbi:hypothetical protein QVD17_20172 [Tagetes erecta]|uniref:Uncharacterized protein n=1 Tax=Tagetes erecta TaxID=13708 RepID=A0AAD8NX33_TARER|nr:hypothetical protein QVD17_20172 [Tagetes erecta]